MTCSSHINEVNRERGEIAERVQALRREARTLARAHVGELERLILMTSQAAAGVAEGGEPYPIGVREIARRLRQDLEDAAARLTSLNLRP
jgi:hypothetical protein